MRGPNFTKLGKDIGLSSLHCKFVSECRYLAAFLNVGGSKLNVVENDAQLLWVGSKYESILLLLWTATQSRDHYSQ